MFRIFLILLLLSAPFGCEESDVDDVHAAAVSAQAEVDVEQASALVMMSGTVRVFGREEVGLSGVTVCEDRTRSCATSDGSGDFELFVHERSEVLLVASRPDLFTSLVPTRASEGTQTVLVVPRVAGEAFIELADGDASDETGMIFVDVVDSQGAGMPGVWLTIRDFAAWGPIYTEEGIVPVTGRDGTGERGFAAYLELPEGLEEVGVGATGRSCQSDSTPTNAEGLFALPVRAGAVTWLSVTCI